MKILITNALLCDPESKYNQKVCDIFIDQFKIIGIEPSSKKAFSQKVQKTINAKGSWVLPAFTDMRCALRDPGFEYKEDLSSGAMAALAGGFSTLCCLPSTLPPLQSKAEIDYIVNKGKKQPVTILPYGCISYNREGKELSEMYDMHLAGAIGFTDANKPVMSSALMLKALTYAKLFNGLVLSHADDTSLSAFGRMHEGNMSTHLGLKGIPSMAEELMIKRDLELARYAETKIHFSHISSKGSVDIIRKAKKAGQQVTCDVSVANLCYTDEELATYDSNFKVNPPLRTKSDQKELWNGLSDGTIDAIVTDHQPENTEAKDVEFEYAAMGMSTLQTTFNLLLNYKPKGVNLDVIINALAWQPRKVLNLPSAAIQNNAIANLTIFNPNAKWILNADSHFSKSINNPLLGKEITGKFEWSIINHQIHQF